MPNKVYSWGLFKQNIAINQIVEAGYTACYAAKWVGKKGLMFDSIHLTSLEDMVQSIYDLMEEADAIVTYNGNKFDLPTLNREFVSQGLTPPAPSKSIDLYSVVRSKFRFTSNKLDFVCQQLNLGGKVQHTGMQLWKDCMDGCNKAWKLMEKYNKQDVVILEKLYNKLLPWQDTHPHRGLYIDNDAPVCRCCGSTKLQRRGYAMTPLGKYRRYSCKACGKWGRGKKMLKGVDVR